MQGSAWLPGAAGRGHWGIGPGGHPMGGVSAASSRNLVGEEVVGVEFHLTSLPSLFISVLCLSVEAARLGQESPGPSTCCAWVDEGREQFTSAD